MADVDLEVRARVAGGAWLDLMDDTLTSDSVGAVQRALARSLHSQAAAIEAHVLLNEVPSETGRDLAELDRQLKEEADCG